MELLSFPAITVEEEKSIRDFLKLCEVVSIDEDICEKTIAVRKNYSIKLPDSIIAATAIIKKLPLITADTVFARIDELSVEKLVPNP